MMPISNTEQDSQLTAEERESAKRQGRSAPPVTRGTLRALGRLHATCRRNDRDGEGT